MADATGAVGRIMTVCTANVCRSPLAELHLREALRGGPLAGAEISSAGVRGQVGAPMCAVARGALDDASSGDGHVAREVTAELIEQADLVLAMEREQRGALARLAPGQQGKIFTLREAAAMIEVIGAQEPRPTTVGELVDRMRSLRGVIRPPAAESVRPQGLLGRLRRAAPQQPDDGLSIDDGHNIDPDSHARTVETVRDLTGRMASALSR